MLLRTGVRPGARVRIGPGWSIVFQGLEGYRRVDGIGDDRSVSEDAPHIKYVVRWLWVSAVQPFAAKLSANRINV